MNYLKPGNWLLALVLCASATCALAHPPSIDVRVGVHPPPARFEQVPAPRAGYAWSHGYWGWRGGAHVWIGGQWLAERPGYRYYDARWVLVDGAWALYPGYWEPYAVAPVVVQAAPVVIQPVETQYMEKPQSAAPPQLDPRYWYYCPNPGGYYPYVRECPAGWQQVVPTPR